MSHVSYIHLFQSDNVLKFFYLFSIFVCQFFSMYITILKKTFGGNKNEKTKSMRYKYFSKAI